MQLGGTPSNWGSIEAIWGAQKQFQGYRSNWGDTKSGEGTQEWGMNKAWQPVSSGHPVSLVTHQALHWVPGSSQPPAVSDPPIWNSGGLRVTGHGEALVWRRVR